ncbi:MAG: YlxR family protein [Desulfohalobiaceae bacterium]|nr:YlxR family protein [Desulfohalobiaceae bacterium]
MCVICRQRFPKSRLSRYVKRKTGARKKTVFEDPGQDMAGRGFYICSSPACREKKEKFTGLHSKCRG